MDTFTALGLQCDPFLDTADPTFYFPTPSQAQALQRLELAVRLGRGLSVVLGDVGSGKTTLAQALLWQLLQDDSIFVGSILDPGYESEDEFLEALRLVFGLDAPPSASRLALKNQLKHHLYELGVEQGKRVVLVIDEGQKLSLPVLESLRIFLNYQTPQRKLLNMVLLSQLELLPRIRSRSNLMDRIAVLHHVPPLTQDETRGLIRFRLQRAGLPDDRSLFTPEACDAIHATSGGRPRQITMLCQQALEATVARGATHIESQLIYELARQRSEALVVAQATSLDAAPHIAAELPAEAASQPSVQGSASDPAGLPDARLAPPPEGSHGEGLVAAGGPAATSTQVTLPEPPARNQGTSFWQHLFGRTP